MSTFTGRNAPTGLKHGGIQYFRKVSDPLHQYTSSVLGTNRPTSKHTAKKLAYTLQLAGFKAAEIHSNRSLAQRRAALDGFKAGKYHILVATDIAARGIDVIGIGTVLNYDLPENPEDYVHRIGRTGRAGKAGYALSFAVLSQRGLVKQIEKLTHTTITVTGKPLTEHEVTLHEMSQAFSKRGGSKNTSWKRPSGSQGYARGKRNGFGKQSGFHKQRGNRW